jgi:hypothetical protein
MARDYTKYQVEGIDGVFGKGKLVLAVVQDYCSKNECTFDELKAAFPDEAQGGNTGVFGTLLEAQEIAKKRARHFVNDKIILKDAIIVVSNQWGDNLHLFIKQAEALGYSIQESETENINKKGKRFDEINEILGYSLIDGKGYLDDPECLYEVFDEVEVEDIKIWVENTDFNVIAGLSYWPDHSWEAEHQPVLKAMAYKLVEFDLNDAANLDSFYDGNGDAFGALCCGSGYIHMMLEPNFYKEIIPIGNKLLSQAAIIVRNLNLSDEDFEQRLRDFNQGLSNLMNEDIDFDWPSI